MGYATAVAPCMASSNKGPFRSDAASSMPGQVWPPTMNRLAWTRILEKKRFSNRFLQVTLKLFNIATENGPFLDAL